MKTQTRDKQVLIRTTQDEKQGIHELAALMSLRTNGAIVPDSSSVIRGLASAALFALRTNNEAGQWLASHIAQLEG